MHKIINELKPLLNSKVKHMYMLIWPDENGILETDIKVNYCLELKNKEVVSYTFGIETDGQMLEIMKEKIDEDYKLTDLILREKIWENYSFFNSQKNMEYEKFLVNLGSKYEKIIGSYLKKIEILYFEDEIKLPIGLHFLFTSGDNIYCLPGVTKGTILDYFPEEWFPETVYKINIEN